MQVAQKAHRWRNGESCRLIEQVKHLGKRAFFGGQVGDNEIVIHVVWLFDLCFFLLSVSLSLSAKVLTCRASVSSKSLLAANTHWVCFKFLKENNGAADTVCSSCADLPPALTGPYRPCICSFK